MRGATVEERPLAVPVRDGHLLASLSVPQRPLGLAVLAGDGARSRDGDPQEVLAGAVRQAGFATLAVDLLTPAELSDEACAAAVRLDATGLAARLHAVRDFIATRPELSFLPLALFGSGGAGAAALVEAGCFARGVAAVVADCRSPGRAGAALARVRAPVLLIAEGGDLPALERLEDAARLLHAPHALASVPGPRTGHTRALRNIEVAHQVARWLAEHAVPEAAHRSAGNRAQSRGAG